jgi:uncharacterized Fe-S cluster protein YjdI
MQVTWDETKCCHAGVCVRSLPEVFQIKDGQFVIEPTKGLEGDIFHVVNQCPSGALQVSEDNVESSS